ncbi:MAG: hypothetical protein ACTINA_07155 [Pseudoalteromonas distincta]
MSKQHNYLAVHADHAAPFLNKITNGANCPVCKTGELKFLGSENNLIGVSELPIDCLTSSYKIATVNALVFTLICSDCFILQTLNATHFLNALDNKTN